MTSLRKLVKENDVCCLPWLEAEIHLQNDFVRPCCKYEGNLKTTNDVFPIVWQQGFKKIRDDFKAGNTIPECNACNISQDVFSYKNKKAKEYAMWLDLETNSRPALPRVFHISLKNICNLACRMCNPSQSSKLGQFVSNVPDLSKYYFYSPVDNKVDPASLAGSFSEAMSVTFAGGEPFVDDDCLKILKLIQAESSNLMYINIITNMTTVNVELLDLISNMGAEVCLSVSIDGPPNLQEYIRHFSKWDKMYSNMKYIRTHYPNIKFGVNTTVSILNVGYIVDTIEFLHGLEIDLQTKFKYCLPSIVLDKKFLFPANLPDTVKEQYLSKLNSYTGPLTIPETANLLKSAKGLLEEQPRAMFSEFINFISQFDKKAGTDYKAMYPEMVL